MMKGDINSRKNKTLEQLEQDLYNPAFTPEHRSRRRIHDRDIELEKDFDTEEYENALNARPKYELPTSLFKKVFLLALGFFAVAATVVWGALYDRQSRASGDMIALEVVAQPFIDSGDRLAFEVRIQNFNEQTLELPDLLISYAKDSGGMNTERGFLPRRSLPDIEGSQQLIESYEVTLFGQAGDIRDLQVILEYRLAGSNSIFIKEVAHEILIRSAPTEMVVRAPETVVRNQEIILSVDVSSNTITRVQNTLLKVQYPRGFEFISSNIEPHFSNNTWQFPSLSQEPQTIEIRGRLSALEGQSQSFHAEFGRQNALNKNQIETVLNSHVHVVTVRESFVDATLQINNSTDEKSTLRGGGTINVVLRYRNTLDEALENVIITLNLDGELYDPSRINLQNGFYNSSRKAIVFDQTTAERLRLVQPGQGGEFRFTLYGRDLVGTGGVLKNPQIVLSTDVEGTRSNGNHEQAFGVSRHVVQANSDIAVLAEAQFNEGPFNNLGPMPPRVNMPTNYTLVFGITNSSNDIENAELSTFLPPSVEWMNAISPSIERNNITYDATTRKITWRLGTVSAGIGVGTNQPRQVSIQVTLTPSAAQIGNPVDMTRDILLIGKDTFSGTDLSYRKTPLANQLRDRNIVGYDGRVVQ